MNDNRIIHHQILGELPKTKWVTITVDGKKIKAREGETVAAALIAAGVKLFRYSVKISEPRSLFCTIGSSDFDTYRIDTSYNCQVSLTKEQIMLSSEVVTQASDRKALELMVKTSKANLAHPVKEIAADAGYSSYDNYEYLEKTNKTTIGSFDFTLGLWR
ncbi:hypothetical protein ES705_33050 [subsurface metagenome]